VKINRELPDEASRYLRALHRSLAALPKEDRDEVIEGVEGHIRDALAGGERTVEEVLLNLGSPEDVAAPALDEFERRSESLNSDGHFTVPRVAQIGAFVFVIAATLAAVLLPSNVRVNITEPGAPRIETPTLLEINPPTVLIPLAIPLVLTLIPLLVRAKRWRIISIVCVVLLAVFTVIASASVGWFYIPALLAGLVAVLYRPKHETVASR
jgi:hypothetical protein